MVPMLLLALPLRPEPSLVLRSMVILVLRSVLDRLRALNPALAKARSAKPGAGEGSGTLGAETGSTSGLMTGCEPCYWHWRRCRALRRSHWC